MSSINLMIDEENELTFQVQIEGTRPGEAKCRLMLETEDMSLAFSGRSNGEEVEVILTNEEAIEMFDHRLIMSSKKGLTT